MTTILQLNPSIPMVVTSKDMREGEAMFLMERSPEHFTYWGVVFDDTGEIWWVPNNEVRVTTCWTTGRPPRGKKLSLSDLMKGVNNDK